MGVPAGAGLFSLRHRVQTSSGSYSAPYSMGTEGSLPETRAQGHFASAECHIERKLPTKTITLS